MTTKGPGRGMCRGVGALVLTVMVAFGGAGEVSAQDAPGFTFLAGLGYQDGGPGPDLVDALVAGGLGDIRPGTCAGAVCEDSVDYPLHFSEGIGLAVNLGFRYRFDAPLSLEVLLSNGQRGHAEGFEGQPLQNTLIIQYSSYVVGSTMGVHLGPLRVGAGPAILFTAWNATENFAVEKSTSTTSLGATAEISYSVPLVSTVLGVRAALHQFGSSRIPNTLDVAVEADYRTFEVGITVAPRMD